MNREIDDTTNDAAGHALKPRGVEEADIEGNVFRHIDEADTEGHANPPGRPFKK